MNTTTQTTAQTIQQVINLINEMDCHELIELNNQYLCSINASRDQIFGNDEDFLNCFFYNKPTELAQCISFGDYRYQDNFVRFDGYGNLESFNYFDTDMLCELVPTMAEYIVENPSDFTQFDKIEFNNIED